MSLNYAPEFGAWNSASEVHRFTIADASRSFSGMNFCRLPLALLFALVSQVSHTAAKLAPDYAELRALLHANLPGATDVNLDQAASMGLLATFTNQVRWEPLSASPTNSTPLVTAGNLVEQNFAVLRVGRVAAGLDVALTAELQKLAVSNRIVGVVVDLRFADGEDFVAAQRAAGFPGSYPHAVLINASTRGAAVSLAAELRARRALLIGEHTAGDAAEWSTFTLRDGRRLHIMTNATAFAAGIAPDIAVNVSPSDEKIFLTDAYAELEKTVPSINATNHPSPRVTEADLVRARRDGAVEPEEELASAETTTATKPVRALRDPALARAVDLLRGLTLLRTVK